MATRIAALAGLLGLLAGAAAAQTEDYPTRDVKLVVPSAPGGNPDVLGRLLAAKLTQSLGKAFLVENQPGAGGTIATNAAAKAPDAYTLVLADSSPLTIAPSLYAKLPYDPFKDFTPITSLAAVPTLLVVVPAAVPSDSLAGFVAFAKARPGFINWGSAGPGGIHHLTMAVFAQRAGIKVEHVPYRGGGPIIAGLLAGEVHAAFIGIPNAIEQINSGKLKTLGISTPVRFKGMPGVPTIAEQGYPGFDIATNIGLVARAGTSPAIVAKLQAAVAKALREPDVAERTEFLGMVLTEDGTQSFTALIRSEYERYARIIKDNDIKVE